MTSRDFVYWLQGLFELGADPVTTLNERQTTLIRAHLQMVFVHEIDAGMLNPRLDAIHDAVKKTTKDLEEAVIEAEKQAPPLPPTPKPPAAWHPSMEPHSLTKARC